MVMVVLRGSVAVLAAQTSPMWALPVPVACATVSQLAVLVIVQFQLLSSEILIMLFPPAAVKLMAVGVIVKGFGAAAAVLSSLEHDSNPPRVSNSTSAEIKFFVVIFMRIKVWLLSFRRRLMFSQLLQRYI
jgi:hypothetical protein